MSKSSTAKKPPRARSPKPIPDERIPYLVKDPKLGPSARLATPIDPPAPTSWGAEAERPIPYVVTSQAELDRATGGGWTMPEVSEVVAVPVEPGARLDLTGLVGSAPAKPDPVNHPAHYTSSPARCTCGRTIECIDVVRHLPFDRGNVIKYLWRAGSKPTATEIEDLEKALWYLKDELARVKAEASP